MAKPRLVRELRHSHQTSRVDIMAAYADADLPTLQHALTEFEKEIGDISKREQELLLRLQRCELELKYMRDLMALKEKYEADAEEMSHVSEFAIRAHESATAVPELPLDPGELARRTAAMSSDDHRRQKARVTNHSEVIDAGLDYRCTDAAEPAVEAPAAPFHRAVGVEQPELPAVGCLLRSASL